MTGSRNGTVSLWKDKTIEKSEKIFNEWTLVLYKGNHIFAASENEKVVELNMNLNLVKKFNGHRSRPFTIDATTNYLAVGYRKVDFIGHVEVHSRKNQGQNGTHQKILVRNAIFISMLTKFTTGIPSF